MLRDYVYTAMSLILDRRLTELKGIVADLGEVCALLSAILVIQVNCMQNLTYLLNFTILNTHLA